MIYDTLFPAFTQKAGRVEKWKEQNGWKLDLTAKKE
jgi:hypothetical protein